MVSTASGVHFEMGVLAESVELHQRLSGAELFERFALFGTSILTHLPARCDEGAKFVRGDTVTQRLTQVDALGGIQAQIPQTVGRETAAVTGVTKGHGG